jgi:hypothetical protein
MYEVTDAIYTGLGELTARFRRDDPAPRAATPVT